MFLAFSVWAVDARIGQQTDQKLDQLETRIYDGLDGKEKKYLLMKQKVLKEEGKNLNIDDQIRLDYLEK